MIAPIVGLLEKSKAAPRGERLRIRLERAVAPPWGKCVRLGLALIGVRADTTDSSEGLAGYLLPFEIVSVHLLVVLIGAAYLARAKRRRNEAGVQS
jgi:hypothetical protein